MAKRKVKEQTSPATDRKKWSNIFNALMKMLQTQQSQIETLADERKLLEDRIKLQYDRWVSNSRLFEDQISLLKSEAVSTKKELLVGAAKTDLVVGSKRRQAFRSNLNLENAVGELEDFKSWFDILCHRCPSEENVSPSLPQIVSKRKDRLKSSSKNVDTDALCKTMESELARVKREFEKIAVKNKCDVSVLQAEKDFVWNQYKEREKKYIDMLDLKNDEVKQANEKVVKLLASLEQQNTSNRDKDDKIKSLEDDRAKLEADTNRKAEEISRLSKKLELLRRSKVALASELQNGKTQQKGSGSEGKRHRSSSERSQMESKASTSEGRNGKSLKSGISGPLLQRCTSQSASFNSENNNKARSTRSCMRVGKVSDPGTERKRRKVSFTMSDTPSLFNSSFKIPKLKSLSASSS